MGRFVQLFPDREPAPSTAERARSPQSRIRMRLGRAAARTVSVTVPITLPRAVALSIIVHAGLLALLALRDTGGGRPAAAQDLALFAEAVESLREEEPGAIWPGLNLASGETPSPADLRLFARAVRELVEADAAWSVEEAAGAPAARPGEAGPAPDLSIVFGAGLSDVDKVEIFKQLLRSGAEPNPAEGGVATGVRLDSGDKVFLSGSAAGGGRVAIHRLEKADADMLEALKSSGDYEPEPPADTTGTVRLGSGALSRDVPAAYYFRACPYERMLARGADLFTVVKGFPELPLEAPAAAGDPAAPDAAAEAAAPPRLFVRILRSAPVPAARTEGARVPAAGEELERTLNELMAYPEDAQFHLFERAYLEPGDLDDEDLARLTREFLFSNVNGAFFVVDRLTTAFDALEDLHYKRDVFDRLAGWIGRAPRSRIAAELLFYLASAYDYEKRVLLHLMDAREEAEGILTGTISRPAVFNPRVKAYVVKALSDKLRARLSAAGCPSVDEAVARYTAAQERIYGALLSMSGETRNRALFAAARLRWEEGGTDAALDLWRRISVTTSIESAHRIRRVLDAPSFLRLPEKIAVDRINKILADDSFRNSARLHQRAIRFDKWGVRSGALPPEKSGGRTPGRPPAVILLMGDV